MIEPCMSVDMFLSAAGIGNGIARRRRPKMVRELRARMDPTTRRAVNGDVLPAAASWQWPLSELVHALDAVVAAEELEHEPLEVLRSDLMTARPDWADHSETARMIDRVLAYLETLAETK